jgi:hypothetical protein
MQKIKCTGLEEALRASGICGHFLELACIAIFSLQRFYDQAVSNGPSGNLDSHWLAIDHRCYALDVGFELPATQA